MPPHSTYSFRHALIQDAAYSGLLLAERRTLHRRIAESLSRRSDAANVRPELVAYHYTKAGDAEEAIAYWQEAANKHAITQLMPRPSSISRRHWSSPSVAGRRRARPTRVAVARRARDQPRGRRRLRLSGSGAELCARSRAMPPIRLHHGDRPVLLGLFVFHLVRADHQIARELAEQCMPITRSAEYVNT